MSIITVRGRTFEVNSASGSQLAFIKAHYAQQSDELLDRNAAEYELQMEIHNVEDKGTFD
jgi:hypothetical protein